MYLIGVILIEIFTLGTGSAVPSLIRNHSSTAIRKEGDIYLFDCGEATQHQIQKVKLKHSKFKAVLISHLHGDHIFGLMGFLSTLSLNGRQKKLKIYGPEGIKKYIKFNLKFIQGNIIFPLEIIEVECMKEYQIDENVYVKPFKLDHTIKTFGYLWWEKDKPGKFNLKKAEKLDIPPGPLYSKLQRGKTITVNGKTIKPDDVLGKPRKGKKIGYVLDTQPCESAEDIAAESDVLIFDATYKEEDKKYARRGKHTTQQEAINIAKQNEVEKLILTHFSQRYMEKFKNYFDDYLEIIYAYDCMKIKL
ncbi:MAG: ribonuclease Z [Candidatus Mcinerneyibacterium aminivorans]|uniref:Ribonuclease Z n=1 Tax=Candidatus Mcinerneyibacterium aminivorans TaxID=2703815 RepID=A0A5D0MB57_9BACT|nr:MAG: ribonuclease Z [Candidatus Mcinerneyibacterium aminivorans]